MKKTTYFYRTLSSSDFKGFDKPKSIVPVRLKNSWTKDFYYFCNSDSCWKTASLITGETITGSDGNTVDGYPVEFTEYPIGKYEVGGISDICGETRLYNFFDYSPKEMELYLLERNVFRKRRNFYRQNSYDSRGCTKDIFGANITVDDEEASIEITFRVFDRNAFYQKNIENHEKYNRSFLRQGLDKMIEKEPNLFNHLYDYNSEMPDIRENKLIINLKDGSFYFEEGSTWYFSIEEDYNWKYSLKQFFKKDELLGGKDYWPAIQEKLKSLQENIPLYIQNEIFSRFIPLAEKKFKVSYSTGHKIDKNNLLITIYKITKLPYEPNLYQVITNRYISSKHPFTIKRNNPHIFKKFCRKYHIKQYKVLRRCYELNPECLIVFIKLWKSGFRDLNYFNKVLESEKYCKMITAFEDDASLVFFCKYCKKYRGELSALNILLSEKEAIQIKIDAMYMFKHYFKDIPKTLREDIVRNGLTAFNHDALSRISYISRNKKIEFKYSHKEKRFEDEIEGYSFKLPTDNYQLCDIGTALHNCVGSYTDRITKGKCLVVYAEKDGQYKICIEVVGKTVKQQRIDHNAAPDENEMRILEIWQKRHGLKVQSDDLD